MDQAKAIINLNEGIIQLEGPVEFVQCYLERYAPAMKGVSTPAPLTDGAAKQTRTRGRGRGGRASCARAIRAEIKTGFFDEAKSTKAVRERLTEKGISCLEWFAAHQSEGGCRRGETTDVWKGKGRPLRKED